MNLPLDERFIAKYLTKIIKETGITYESVAEKCGTSESTVKNLCSGKTENPGLLTIAPIVYAVNGSLDEMCGKSREDIDDKTKNLIKEMSEFQFAEYRKTEEAHINNMRTHYEQHREDTITNYERLLTEKENQNNRRINNSRITYNTPHTVVNKLLYQKQTYRQNIPPR